MSASYGYREEFLTAFSLLQIFDRVFFDITFADADIEFLSLSIHNLINNNNNNIYIYIAPFPRDTKRCWNHQITVY